MKKIQKQSLDILNTVWCSNVREDNSWTPVATLNFIEDGELLKAVKSCKVRVGKTKAGKPTYSLSITVYCELDGTIVSKPSSHVKTLVATINKYSRAGLGDQQAIDPANVYLTVNKTKDGNVTTAGIINDGEA